MIRAALAATATATMLAPTAHAYEFELCPSGLTGVVTEDTSCAFADNVRFSWYAQGGSIVNAFSPVTGKMYTMQCVPTSTDAWPRAQRCVGVNDSGAGLIVIIS
jgi:hypothetical protein